MTSDPNKNQDKQKANESLRPQIEERERSQREVVQALREWCIEQGIELPNENHMFVLISEFAAARMLQRTFLSA